MRRVQVRPFNEASLRGSEYDVFVACAGFETRARYIAEMCGIQALTKLAPAFHDRKVFDFDKNVKWFRDAGFDVNELSNDEFINWIKQTIAIKAERHNADRPLSVCVDVSSMSRLRIAAVVDAFALLECAVPIDVDFLYALAKFSKPSSETGVIEVAEPVLETFSGWTNEPERPISAIVGLGYEPEKVLGVAEFLEPTELWAFMPHGPDPRFLAAAEKANRNLLNEIGLRRVIPYKVKNAFDMFVSLESLTYGILMNGRPVLIPFGPKIFATAALLVGIVHYPDVAVWRVSGGIGDVPLNRKADGNVVGLSVAFAELVHTNEVLAEDSAGAAGFL